MESEKTNEERKTLFEFLGLQLPEEMLDEYLVRICGEMESEGYADNIRRFAVLAAYRYGREIERRYLLYMEVMKFRLSGLRSTLSDKDKVAIAQVLGDDIEGLMASVNDSMAWHEDIINHIIGLKPEEGKEE